MKTFKDEGEDPWLKVIAQARLQKQLRGSVIDNYIKSGAKKKNRCPSCNCISLDNKKKCMFSYKSPFKKAWDVFVIGLAIYNSLLIPFDLAFKSEFARTPIFETLDGFVDLCFLVDIIFTFMTSFLNKHG